MAKLRKPPPSSQPPTAVSTVSAPTSAYPRSSRPNSTLQTSRNAETPIQGHSTASAYFDNISTSLSSSGRSSQPLSRTMSYARSLTTDKDGGDPIYASTASSSYNGGREKLVVRASEVSAVQQVASGYSGGSRSAARALPPVPAPTRTAMTEGEQYWAARAYAAEMQLLSTREGRARAVGGVSEVKMVEGAS